MKEKHFEIYFRIGGHSGHLGLTIGTILAIYPDDLKKKVMGIMLTPPSVRPPARPSVRRDECIHVWFKIMDASVHFNGIYSVDTQADFVCRKLRTKYPCVSNFDTQGYFVRKETQKYTSVKTSVRPFFCPSRYLLLNHLAEFNQTCYITYPRGKDVREQHYFSVRP